MSSQIRIVLFFTFVSLSISSLAPSESSKCYKEKCSEEITQLGSTSGEEFEQIGYEQYKYEQCTQINCEVEDEDDSFGAKDGENQQIQIKLQDCHYKCGSFLKNEKAKRAHKCALKCMGVDVDKREQRQFMISMVIYIILGVIASAIILSCVGKCLEAKQSSDRFKKQDMCYKAKMAEIQQQQCMESQACLKSL